MDADLVIWDPEAKFQVCHIIMLNINNTYAYNVKTQQLPQSPLLQATEGLVLAETSVKDKLHTFQHQVCCQMCPAHGVKR
jgi:hypothetical protein